MLTFWLALQVGRAHADTVSGNSNVTGTLDVEGGDLSIGTNAATTDWGVDFAYTDGTNSFLDFVASRSTNTWRWKQNGSGTFKIQMSLDSGSKLSLFDSTGTAQIVLDPAASATSSIGGSLTVNGSDNQMPNQMVTSASSILTVGIADVRYPSFSEGGLSLFGGTSSGYTGSLALGWMTVASGSNSFAVGSATTASGVYSAAMGNYSTASGKNAFAAGNGSIAAALNSAALGDTTSADAFDSFVIGRNNMGGGSPTNWVSSDPLFEIGNGSSDGGVVPGHLVYGMDFNYQSPDWPMGYLDGDPQGDLGPAPLSVAMVLYLIDNDTGQIYSYDDYPDTASITGYTVYVRPEFWIPTYDSSHRDAFLVRKNGNVDIQNKLNTGSDITAGGDLFVAGLPTEDSSGVHPHAGNVTATGNVTAGGSVTSSSISTGSVTAGTVTTGSLIITAPAPDIPMYSGD